MVKIYFGPRHNLVVTTFYYSHHPETKATPMLCHLSPFRKRLVVGLNLHLSWNFVMANTSAGILAWKTRGEADWSLSSYCKFVIQMTTLHPEEKRRTSHKYLPCSKFQGSLLCVFVVCSLGVEVVFLPGMVGILQVAGGWGSQASLTAEHKGRAAQRQSASPTAPSSPQSRQR